MDRFSVDRWVDAYRNGASITKDSISLSDIYGIISVGRSHRVYEVTYL